MSCLWCNVDAHFQLIDSSNSIHTDGIHAGVMESVQSPVQSHPHEFLVLATRAEMDLANVGIAADASGILAGAGSAAGIDVDPGKFKFFETGYIGADAELGCTEVVNLAQISRLLRRGGLALYMCTFECGCYKCWHRNALRLDSRFDVSIIDSFGKNSEQSKGVFSP
jgi:hypothetical protein